MANLESPKIVTNTRSDDRTRQGSKVTLRWSLMNQTMPAELDEIVQTIVAEVNPEQVILFGSRARGDARPNSDLDLVVVESRPFGEDRTAHDEEVKILRAVARFKVAIDVLVCSRGEFDYWKETLNHVLARAAREGIVVYARP